jgi:tetratricopeptide (TPR) repeat protein
MAEITVDESWRQVRALVDRAEQAAEERRWTDAIERLRAVLAHPCAHHQVVAYEVLDDIHQTWRQAGHYDDAIAAKREAIEAGYRSVPDPEADIAECLLAAGRRDEADALFATLRERDPEDVWLYNAAAYSYAEVDMAASLKWALDQPADDALIERVERFCEEWIPVPSRSPWADAPPLEDRPCAYCGYEPEASRAELGERARRNRRRLLEVEAPEALARFDALDDLPADHLAYSHETEARIKRIARHTPGNRLHVATMTVDGLQAHAEESSHDPASGEARSSYAATLLQTGSAVVWPPGRNDACWCGSDRKYKKCCGPVPAAEDAVG